VHKSLNMKVVGLTTLQLSQRPYRVFLNRFCTKGLPTLNATQLGKFSTFFHSKFKMSIYMKVVSLNKLDNFHKGRFLSV
jgi:hypothetical protein